MSDKTSQSETNNDSLDHEGSGICAPVRLAHPIPHQRYGWRATVIVFAHILVLAVFLLRFDFLSGRSASSRPETLNVIVVDLSGDSDTAAPAEPVAEPSFTSQPQSVSLAPPSESQPTQVVPTIPVEPTVQPVVETLSTNKEALTTPPIETSARPEPPAPANTPVTKAERPAPAAPTSKPVVATASRNISAPSTSSTNNPSPQPTIGLSTESESQTTPPRLDPAYLHNPAPTYPALSKRNRESGTVLLLVKVDPDGNASTVTLHKSSGHERLDQAAIQAVTLWRFVPGMRGQTAISATVIVPISFKHP